MNQITFVAMVHIGLLKLNSSNFVNYVHTPCCTELVNTTNCELPWFLHAKIYIVPHLAQTAWKSCMQHTKAYHVTIMDSDHNNIILL